MLAGIYLSGERLPSNSPANNYLFQVNSRYTRARFQIFSKYTINTLEYEKLSIKLAIKAPLTSFCSFYC